MRAAGRARGALRQLAILTSRYFRTVTRDGRNAALLLAQAPLIAYLIGLSLLYGGSDIAYTKPKNTILFLLAMTAVWFGCSNAARELVKERAIYLRERMVNLRIVPYVLSKVVVLSAFAFIQCVLLLFILDVWFGVPGSMGLMLGGMLLASLVGILLGLALSALVGSADRAMTLLPILLIPQVLFTIPAVQMDMKGPAGIVARAMPTWWAYDLLRRVALEPDAHAVRRGDRRAAAGGRAGAHDPRPLRGDGPAGLHALPAPRGHRDHVDGLAAGRAGQAAAREARVLAAGGGRTRWRWRHLRWPCSPPPSLCSAATTGGPDPPVRASVLGGGLRRRGAEERHPVDAAITRGRDAEEVRVQLRFLLELGHRRVQRSGLDGARLRPRPRLGDHELHLHREADVFLAASGAPRRSCPSGT